MKSTQLIFLCLPLVACSASNVTGSQTSSGSASGSGGQGTGSNAATGNGSTGASASGSPSTTGGTAGSGSVSTTGATSGTNASAGVSTAGATSGGSASAGVSTTGGTSGMAGSGTVSPSGSSGNAATTGASGGASSGGVNFDAGLPPGSINAIPAGYTGTPFALNVIPGFIYIGNYDKGGAGVAYCHATPGVTDPVKCQASVKLNDWCCGTMKGCDERLQPAVCPIYRADNDNAGLSHMNTGEPDRYALTGPTWIPGANGPTLTGPVAMAGTNVPQDANTTTEQDAYLSYTYTAEWLKFTVEVLAAGTYSVGGFMGTPGGTQLSLDFGTVNGTDITTGPFTPPASPINMCQCPETYHSWESVANLGMVTIPAPGTYLMTFTIVMNTINPLYFTFTKM